MTAEECHDRASECAANAVLAVEEPISLEFMKLSAQWRAMAVRLIYLGPVEERSFAPPKAHSRSAPSA